MTDTELIAAEAENALPVVPRVTEPGFAERAERIEEHTLWPVLSRLPVVLTVRIPLSAFKVRDLLQLQQGQLIRSDWSTTEDIPVKIGRVQLAWSEFEVVDECMAMRLTRLA
ncbi:FliM/FliN family flagellar motor switch protein [Granulicella arctica]|uniref:Flagellar motor switch protein FliN/FliY n=1 Tax=Granulicella arctica TaxID=940613 RepID=A0A7Y9PI53_9BACT|nr:FliM/FliN family flagellar motor switch protein [Granulicella arctica]NYF80348.1 flagellar motor switch protein FliN/FliY [Granulicella arctica]